MHKGVSLPLTAAGAAILIFGTGCGRQPTDAAAASPRTVTVAQSGPADVVGTDSAALQEAADLLRPGDTLQIGPGTYEMNDSLLAPSGVTVRGTAGQTILKKSAGVESALAEDGDYGEMLVAVAEPQKFRPGMGISIADDTLSSGWDISISSVRAVKGPYLQISPMTETRLRPGT